MARTEAKSEAKSVPGFAHFWALVHVKTAVV